VPRLGPKAFEQAAGFLKIPGGDDPLDSSSVHPEAYPVVRRILTTTGQDLRSLIGNTKVLKSLRPDQFVDDTFGLPTVTDILTELEKPGRDPRPAFKTAVFAEGVDKIGDLSPGMQLEGQVTNVAAFGAFIDIGVHQDGLAHVSALSKNYVKDPREVVKPGDIVKVKVLEVDIPRQRISLTLRLDDEPGAATPHRGPRSGATSGTTAAGTAAGTGASEGRAPRRVSPAAARPGNAGKAPAGSAVRPPGPTARAGVTAAANAVRVRRSRPRRSTRRRWRRRSAAPASPFADPRRFYRPLSRAGRSSRPGGSTAA
jgi:uncharacterized protein